MNVDRLKPGLMLATSWCTSCQKWGYASKSEADEALAQIRLARNGKSRKRYVEQRSYQCGWGEWHLTGMRNPPQGITQ